MFSKIKEEIIVGCWMVVGTLLVLTYMVRIVGIVPKVQK